MPRLLKYEPIDYTLLIIRTRRRQAKMPIPNWDDGALSDTHNMPERRDYFLWGSFLLQ